jgi:hypothetical protein
VSDKSSKFIFETNGLTKRREVANGKHEDQFLHNMAGVERAERGVVSFFETLYESDYKINRSVTPDEKQSFRFSKLYESGSSAPAGPGAGEDSIRPAA